MRLTPTAAVVGALLLAGCGSTAEAEPIAAPIPAVSRREMTPDAVVRVYLEAGARGDEATVRDLLDPQCQAVVSLLRVDAVRVDGSPMSLTRTTATASDVTMTSANVAYVVEGTVGGRPVTQSGTLALAARDGPWFVICVPYAITPYG